MIIGGLGLLIVIGVVVMAYYKGVQMSPMEKFLAGLAGVESIAVVFS